MTPASPKSVTFTLALGLAVALGQLASPANAQTRAPTLFEPTGKMPALSPKEELSKFELRDGYRLELVLSEPVIREPMMIAFDGNGRMYVAEMRTYMQDADGTGEHEPKSLVSRHESSRRNGVFDKHTVFAGDLLLPRQLLPLDDRVIIGETDTNDLFIYKDKNRDGRADGKEPFYVGGPRGGNMEHQPNGPLWALDNWLYSTYNAYRLRWTPKGVRKEPTAPNGGQWGVTQDDWGKIWFSNAGGERGITNFQTHIAYAAYDTPAQQADNFREVFPLVGIPDVQGGALRFRPSEKTLNHFTATCGQTVYRGDRLPADLRGDVLLPEPVGRLIRRIKVGAKDGITTVENAYPGSEFIRSTDPNFRPVYTTTGPDGAIYIVDAYRGIIQEGAWTKKGSYLRGVVEQYGFDKNIQRGRIWRLVHESWKPGPQPRMLDDKSAQLVRHLEHPNGWWRDTAQKLLILRGDRSVVPALTALLRKHKEPRARLHALWTLEGLGELTPALAMEALKDADHHVRENAIRAAESVANGLPEAGRAELVTAIRGLLADAEPTVVMQVMGTATRMHWPDHLKLVREQGATNGSDGVAEMSKQLLRKMDPALLEGLDKVEQQLVMNGRGAYLELCFSCHGEDGKGAPMSAAPAGVNTAGQTGTTIAPALLGSRVATGPSEVAIRILLHGLVGPAPDGKTYGAAMVAMKDNDDQWISSVLSYVRHGLAKQGSIIRPEQVARVRKATAARTDPWTVVELDRLASTLPRETARAKAETKPGATPEKR